MVRGRSGDAEASVAELADAGEALGVLHPFSFQGKLKEAERAREPHGKAVGFAAGGLFVQDGGSRGQPIAWVISGSSVGHIPSCP